MSNYTNDLLDFCALEELFGKKTIDIKSARKILKSGLDKYFDESRVESIRNRPCQIKEKDRKLFSEKEYAYLQNKKIQLRKLRNK